MKQGRLIYLGTRFFALCALCSTSFFSSITSAQSVDAKRYSITFETYVGGKLEDKFAVAIAQGEEVKKGFETRLLVKRYLTDGFPYRDLEMRRKSLSDAESYNSSDSGGAKSPLETATAMLDALSSEMDSKQIELDSGHLKYESMVEQKALLERIIKAYRGNAQKMQAALVKYRDKYNVEETDAEIERINRRAPKNRGDYERVDLGSYCEIKLLKVFPQGVSIDALFAYTHIMSWVYADDGSGPSNGKIVKFPMLENFERSAKANVMFGKPYCIQFARGGKGESLSLKSALSQSSLFNMGGAGSNPYMLMPPDNSELNASGTLEEIESKYADDVAKTVRVVIKITPLK